MTEEDKNWVKTVHDFTQPDNRKHFENVVEAAEYANNLLRQGHQVKMFDYDPKYDQPFKYVDMIAQEGPPPGYRSGT